MSVLCAEQMPVLLFVFVLVRVSVCALYSCVDTLFLKVGATREPMLPPSPVKEPLGEMLERKGHQKIANLEAQANLGERRQQLTPSPMLFANVEQ